MRNRGDANLHKPIGWLSAGQLLPSSSNAYWASASQTRNSRSEWGQRHAEPIFEHNFEHTTTALSYSQRAWSMEISTGENPATDGEKQAYHKDLLLVAHYMGVPRGHRRQSPMPKP